MKEKYVIIEIPNLESTDYVRFNDNQYGIYVCKYEDKDELDGLLKNNQCFESAMNRYGILLDIKFANPPLTLAEIKYFKEESSIGVWYLIYNNVLD